MAAVMSILRLLPSVVPYSDSLLELSRNVMIATTIQEDSAKFGMAKDRAE